MEFSMKNPDMNRTSINIIGQLLYSAKLNLVEDNNTVKAYLLLCELEQYLEKQIKLLEK